MQNKEKMEIRKQKKREIDKRYRQKKTKEVIETKNKLATAFIEIEVLRCNIQETNNKLAKDVAEVVETKNKLAIADVENELLKCTNQKLQQQNIQVTEQLNSIKTMFETIHAEMEKEIEDIRAEKEVAECPLNYPITTNI